MPRRVLPRSVWPRRVWSRPCRARRLRYSGLLRRASGLPHFGLFRSTSGLRHSGLLRRASGLPHFGLFRSASGLRHSGLFRSANRLPHFDLFRSASGLPHSGLFRRASGLPHFGLFRSVSRLPHFGLPPAEPAGCHILVSSSEPTGCNTLVSSAEPAGCHTLVSSAAPAGCHTLVSLQQSQQAARGRGCPHSRRCVFIFRVKGLDAAPTLPFQQPWAGPCAVRTPALIRYECMPTPCPHLAHTTSEHSAGIGPRRPAVLYAFEAALDMARNLLVEDLNPVDEHAVIQSLSGRVLCPQRSGLRTRLGEERKGQARTGADGKTQLGDSTRWLRHVVRPGAARAEGHPAASWQPWSSIKPRRPL
eukprot:365991-Chlamydomonas_euryale.AAC.2